jgi:hypothetical protein
MATHPPRDERGRKRLETKLKSVHQNDVIETEEATLLELSARDIAS